MASLTCIRYTTITAYQVGWEKDDDGCEIVSFELLFFAKLVLEMTYANISTCFSFNS